MIIANHRNKILTTLIIECILGKTSALDVLIHGANSMGMMIELFVASHPMYIFHFIYAIGSGMIYLLFTIIYYYAGGVDYFGNNYIYHVLKWENPGSATSVAIGIVVLTIFLHIIVCIIQKCRYRLYKKVKKPAPKLPINNTV